MSKNYSIDELERQILIEPNKSTQGFIYILYFIVIAFFIWTVFFKIEVHIPGKGKIFNNEPTQKIQNRNTRTVKQIFVQNGSVVDKGEVLARFSEQQTKLNNKKSNPSSLKAKNPTHKKIIIQENKLYLKKKAKLKSLIANITKKINQQQQDKNQMTLYIEYKGYRFKSLKTYYDKIKILFAENIANKAELNNAEHNYVKFKKQIEELSKSIESIDKSIKKLNTTLKNHKQELTKISCLKKSDVKVVTKTIQAKKVSIQQPLKTTEIVSPISGIVTRLKLNKIGEVIKADEVIAEIIPINEVVWLKARINSKDITYIKKGQEAVVSLSQFDSSVYGTVKGVVKKVWSTSTVTANGEIYYYITIELEKNYIQGLNSESILILPDMVANVNVITSRLVMEYLLGLIY